ncbi:hypothetical protein MKEN_00387100 [Mycena kentingensis (nom. inval.)]|nr:hypothetical protein MKEN_00387100 [Mycena kentingensis (nom. inval.)]
MQNLAELFPLPDTIPEIDAQLHIFVAHISALKAKRNSLVPLDKLPNELLTRILSIYAHVSGNLLEAQWSKTIMRVCRRWYELAMAEQPLWSYIGVNEFHESRSALYRQLQRAGAAPLTMDANLYTDDRYLVAWMMRFVERTGAFEVHGTTPLLIHFLAELAKHPTPLLQSFRIAGSPARAELPPDAVLAVPRSLFESPDCRLRSLDVSYVDFPWDLPANLHSLHIRHSGNSSSPTTPSVAELVDLLSRCPQLRDLVVRLPDALTPFHTGAVVHLDSLATLEYAGTPQSATALLKAIRVPARANIDLRVWEVNDGKAIRKLIVPLRSHLRAAAKHLHTLVLDTTTIGPLNLGSTSVLTLEFTSTSHVGKNQICRSASAKRKRRTAERKQAKNAASETPGGDGDGSESSLTPLPAAEPEDSDDDDDDEEPAPKQKRGAGGRGKAAKGKEKVVLAADRSLVLMVPRAASASNKRMTLTHDTSWDDALEALYTTIGCAAAEVAPLDLGSEEDWEGCLAEVTAAELKKNAVVSVTISVPEQYMRSLQAKLSGGKSAIAAASGRGRGKKAPILDLEHANSGDDDFDEGLGSMDKETEWTKQVLAHHKKCMLCGPDKPCKIDRAGNHICLTFQMARGWGRSLAAGTYGVTLANPPRDELFHMFHGTKSAQTPGSATPGAPPPPPHFHTPYPLPLLAAAARRSSIPVHTEPPVPSSDPPAMDALNPYPEIGPFLEKLSAANPRRGLDAYGAGFEAEDFYNIDEIAALDEDKLVAKFTMSEGNARFLLTQPAPAVYIYGLTPDCPRVGLAVIPQNERTLRQIVTKLLHAAQTDYITHLDISRVVGVGEASWKPILRNLPALQSLKVSAREEHLAASTRTVTGVFRALIGLAADAPHIHTLRVEVIRHHTHDHTTDFSGGWLRDVVGALETYVAHRRMRHAVVSARALGLVHVLGDDGGLMFYTLHKPVMRRVFRCLRAMGGVLQRQERQWDPANETRMRYTRRKGIWRELGLDGSESSDSEVEIEGE